MGHFWLIYEYILKDLKKFDDLVQEAPQLGFVFSFMGEEEMKIII